MKTRSKLALAIAPLYLLIGWYGGLNYMQRSVDNAFFIILGLFVVGLSYSIPVTFDDEKGEE